MAKTVETQQQTQKKQEAWAEEKSDLAARYRAAKAQVDYSRRPRRFEENEVGSLDEGIVELNRRMIESATLKDNLEDSLNVVVSHLDDLVKQDIPFLVDERQARIASVREAIAKPEVSGPRSCVACWRHSRSKPTTATPSMCRRSASRWGTTKSPPTSFASAVSRFLALARRQACRRV